MTDCDNGKHCDVASENQPDFDEKDRCVAAISSMMGHNKGPDLSPGYDVEPASRRWIAVATDMRFHHLVGCGQPVPPADPTRGSWSRNEAWQDLICEAAWKQRSIVNKGKTVLLDRGQLMAARSWLAQRWNWTEKTVRTWISKLENETMIMIERGQQTGQQKQNLSNVITICNYDIYQTAKELQNLLKGQQRATEGPPRGQQRATEGPELIQGYKDTKEIEREGVLADVAAPAPMIHGDLFAPDPKVEINGVAIKGPGFVLPYDSIDAAGSVAGLTSEQSRGLTAAIASAWVANGTDIKDPMAKLTAALKSLAPPLEPKTKKTRAPVQGSRLPEDWKLPKAWGEWAVDFTARDAAWVRAEGDKFRDYWLSRAGAISRKVDWEATWRNWIRRADEDKGQKPAQQSVYGFNGSYRGRGI